MILSEENNQEKILTDRVLDVHHEQENMPSANGKASPWSRSLSGSCLTIQSVWAFMHWRRKWQPTPVFITALFIIARTLKQPRCPSADEWIRKLWYLYTMEYYAAIKKNTFESVQIRYNEVDETGAYYTE